MVISFPNRVQKPKTQKKLRKNRSFKIILKTFSFPPLRLFFVEFKILADELCAAAEFFFYAKELVVFSDPV